jgi:CDP-glucose 4,6-dehydratase
MNNNYKNKRVLITGASGFKGKWLTKILVRAGATVYDYRFDILDARSIVRHVDSVKPDIAFHLAAVSSPAIADRDKDYAFAVNFYGTSNVVWACVSAGCPVVCASSDQVYFNDGRLGEYFEGDMLCGRSVYFHSKACAERAAEAFGRSRASIVRSSLCIGGNDFCKERLFPSIAEAVRTGVPLVIKHPNFVRPVLHVLDSLRGYLMVGARLMEGTPGEAFNLSPNANMVDTVGEIIASVAFLWPEFHFEIADAGEKDATVTRLSSEKALRRLGWTPVWGINETIRKTVDWYKAQQRCADYTDSVIASYEADIF